MQVLLEGKPASSGALLYTCVTWNCIKLQEYIYTVIMDHLHKASPELHIGAYAEELSAQSS